MRFRQLFLENWRNFQRAEMDLQVGPGYTALLTEFVTRVWRPEIAAKRSASLDRLLAHLHRLGMPGGV